MTHHAQDALFDLAVNRAAEVTGRLGLGHLEVWHTKTRFAIRVPLEKIRACLETRPSGDWFWSGGEAGAWQFGQSKTP